MSTPTFVVKRINGQYVTVPMNACAGSAAAWMIGGSLLLVNGVRGEVGFRGAVAAAFGGWMVARGALGYDPLRGCCSSGSATDWPANQTPSYQNDRDGRAP